MILMMFLSSAGVMDFRKKIQIAAFLFSLLNLWLCEQSLSLSYVLGGEDKVDLAIRV